MIMIDYKCIFVRVKVFIFIIEAKRSVSNRKSVVTPPTRPPDDSQAKGKKTLVDPKM